MMVTKPFRLMDLPRELRDGVYRELLLPAKVRGERLPDKKKRSYSLQPAILRVCKQTYQEASRVLYKETNWVLVTSSEDVSSEDVDDKLSLILIKKIGYPFISSQDPLTFPGTPILRMEMSDGLDTNHKYQASILLPQRDFQFFGEALLAPNRTCTTTLRFDEDAMQNSATREALLYCCSDLRGTHSVTIEGLDPVDCAKLAAIMATPIRRFEEYLERVKTYQQRADRQLAQGRSFDADHTCAEGYFYARWVRELSIKDLPGSNSHNRTELKEREIEMAIRFAYCRTKAGRLKPARKLLDSVLKHDGDFPLPTKQQEIKAHFYKALTFVAGRDDTLAAVEFRMVLGLQPGHAGADEQIDVVKAMLQTIPLAERCNLEAYLKDFMVSYRHGDPESTELSRNEMPVDDISKMVT